MGGVSHKPWRAMAAEKFLTGKNATEANFALAADAEMKNASPLEYNAFKIKLGRACAIVRALTQASERRCRLKMIGNILENLSWIRKEGRLKVTGAAKYAAESGVGRRTHFPSDRPSATVRSSRLT